MVHNSMPAPVSGAMIAVVTMPVWRRTVYRRPRNDYSARAVAVVAADMVIGDVAACDGDCDCREYDCCY
jgi:hypothetical protein